MSNQGSLFPITANRSRGRCRRGFDDTLKAMRTTGRLEPVDTALVALCRVFADQVDAAIADRDESRYTCGVLGARYHAMLSHLLARPDTPHDINSLADLFAGMVHDSTTDA